MIVKNPVVHAYVFALVEGQLEAPGLQKLKQLIIQDHTNTYGPSWQRFPIWNCAMPHQDKGCLRFLFA